MTALCPLRFEPFFRRYLWGGRRLESILGKPLGPGDDYAESWEVADHGPDQSVVRDGPFAGMRLADLRNEYGERLLGRRSGGDRFPLLFKFLDAQRPLSVQVHPGDAMAATLDPPDLGKTEAWIVIHAEPGSRIFAGLEPGTDRSTFEKALRHGDVERFLHSIEPRVGDCVFLPAGVVHAIGAGLVIAEIQQSSDTTFRLFDWNRLGPGGRPRTLHIDQGLRAIDFDHGPVERVTPVPTDEPGRERLIACPYFIVDRVMGTEPRAVGGDGRFHMVAVLKGRADVVFPGNRFPIAFGETALIPAECTTRFEPDGGTVLLDMAPGP
ncbi:MAG: class I mannose-6-phosphate isomerase [Planctomycetes bacterium]|nr:class I mannose-6-phosphate isomerase [Planctomycetota bacterium]